MATFPKSPEPEVVGLDLSSLESVRRCAQELTSKLEHIDYLINNAGLSSVFNRNISPFLYFRISEIFFSLFSLYLELN
jgi:short-subunit dehydrogenase